MLALARIENGATTRFTHRCLRVLSGSRIYRNPVMLIALLSILAVTKSYADSLPDFSALVEQEGDAVVKISVTTEQETSTRGGIPGIDPDQLPEQFRRFFEQNPQFPDRGPRRGAGFGSGFIISEDGYIITNAHVVNDAVEIRVGLPDQRELSAELMGSDESSDIALLKVNAGNLPTVQIGDSDTLRVGEWVLAIGSPFGFEHTATQGIISALARSLPDDTYVPFIQTDVAVNPGNSGGPLFNTDGEVVGVNSQIYSRSGGYQGLSFAIPINVAMSIADQLKDHGYATRGWLGVNIQNVDQALAESFGLSKPGGALIAKVTKDSPADKGGLNSGDVILMFNGKKVPSSSSLPPLVGSVKPGETVDVEIMRNGSRKTLAVKIEALEADQQVSSAAPAKKESPSRLGVQVVDIDKSELEELGLDHGVGISDVEPGGPAAQAGILAGDIIVSLNRSTVESVDDLKTLVEEAPAGEPVPVLVQRQDSPIFLALKLPGNE